MKNWEDSLSNILNVWANPDDRQYLMNELLSFISKVRKQEKKDTEKTIGKTIRKIIEDKGDNSEIVCNDLLNYADWLIKI